MHPTRFERLMLVARLRQFWSLHREGASSSWSLYGVLGGDQEASVNERSSAICRLDDCHANRGPCPHPPPPPASEGVDAAAISLRRSAHPKAQNDDQRALSSRRRRRDAARGSHLASTRWRYAASLSLSDGRGRPERSQGPCRRSAGLAYPKPLKDMSLLCIMRLAIRPRLSLQSTTPPDRPSLPRRARNRMMTLCPSCDYRAGGADRRGA
jgi:hypothetical protein